MLIDRQRPQLFATTTPTVAQGISALIAGLSWQKGIFRPQCPFTISAFGADIS